MGMIEFNRAKQFSNQEDELEKLKQMSSLGGADPKAIRMVAAQKALKSKLVAGQSGKEGLVGAKDAAGSGMGGMGGGLAAAKMGADILGVGSDPQDAKGSAVSGALSGASAGAAFGPYGAAAGAIIGGVAGGISARSARKAAQREAFAKAEEEKAQAVFAVEGQRGQRISEALSGLSSAFSRNFGSTRQVRL